MSMDEPVDIVDENNVILYQSTKHEAHAKGLLHRTVISMVRDSQGRWLMVEQAGHKQDAGQLVAPVGGHARAGETEEEAFMREVLEEVGLEDFDFTLRGRAIFNREVLGRKENHYFILFEIRSDTPLVLNDESVAYVAFTEEELRQAMKDTPQRFGDAFFHLANNFYPHLL